MKAIYRADDGTEFEEEEECRDYERQQELMARPFKSHIYLRGGIEMPLNELDKHISDVYYLDIVSKEDWETIKELMYENYGCAIPCCAGKWYYNTNRDEWCDFATLEHEYQRIKKIFEQGDQTS